MMTSSDAAKANSFTKRLIQQDKVDFIVGASTTGSTMAMVPLVEAAKVPTLALGGRQRHCRADQAQCLPDAAFRSPRRAKGAERHEEEEASPGSRCCPTPADTRKSGRTETQKIAASMGMTISIDETYGERDADMTPLLTHVQQLRCPGVDDVLELGRRRAIIAKNFRQLALKIPLYATHALVSYRIWPAWRALRA